MIVPTLTYCPLVTIHVNNTQKVKIDRLENRAAKIISNRDIVIPKTELIQRKQCCVYVFKCLSNDVCDNFVDYFKVIESKYNTRNNGKLICLPSFRTEVAKKSFHFYGGKCYNDLPSEIRSAVSLQSFKKLLRSHFESDT